MTVLVPALTFAAVAVLVLGPAAEHPVYTARFYGGPSDRLSRVSGFLAVERDGVPLAATSLQARALARSGQSVETRVTLDGDGNAELVFDFAAPPGAFTLELSTSDQQLGRGLVTLDAASWLAHVPRRGGFVGDSPHRSSPLRLRVAAERAVLVPPVASDVLVEFSDARGGLANADVAVTGDGARVTPARALTNRHGVARFALEPHDMLVSLLLRARAETGQAAELSISLPLLPGVLVGDFTKQTLRVRSAIERSEAWVRFWSERGRLYGLRVPLSADGHGGSSAEVPLPELPDEAVWAVVAAEPPIGAARLIGWPRADPASDRPAQSFDAPDLLLLDLGPAARAAEQTRRGRLHALAFVIAALGAAISVASLWRAEASRRQQLTEHWARELDQQTVARLAPRARARSLWVAALVSAGFLVLVALTAWQLLRR